jgi:hypothetical protein
MTHILHPIAQAPNVAVTKVRPPHFAIFTIKRKYDDAFGTNMYPTPMVIQTAAPRSSYRRRSYRPRYRRRRPKLSRGLRTFRSARRKYPASQYGYTFIPRTESTAAGFGNSYREATEAQKQDRINSRYYGRGAYGGQGNFWKKAARFGWKHRGTILGAAASVGVPGASALKRLSGAGVYTGQGEYEGQNGLFSSETADVPTVESSGTEDGAIKISHREYLTDLYGNSYSATGVNLKPFDLQSYEINPGVEQTFPWLSQLAQNFEEYELEQCIFSFRSTVQEVSSANGQVGTITMATLYNVDNPNFRDKTEMMQYAHSNSVKATDDVMHGVECDDAKLSGTDEKYVRSAPLDLGVQKKDYDHGRFQVAISNTPEAFKDASIGELWISYTVTLRKPKIFTARGKGISEFMALTDTSNGLSGAVIDSSATNPFLTPAGGDPFLYARKNSLNIKLTTSATQFVVTFPAAVAGVFSVVVMLKSIVAGATTNSRTNLREPTLGGNVTAFKDIHDVGPDEGDDTSGLSEPGWIRKSYINDEDADDVTEWIRIEAHVRVAPVNTKNDNILKWTPAGQFLKRGPGGGLTATDTVEPLAAIVMVSELPTSTLPLFYSDSDIEREWVNSSGAQVLRA